MPTVAEIQRLEALIDRLVPLSDKQRGQLIAADDWNVIVGALIEIGRAALTAGSAGEVPPHEHTDQVSIGWLDPRVRQLLTGGGVKDPAVETSFLKLRRDVESLSGRLDGVGADVDRSRRRLDEVATNDVTRESMLTRLNRKVLGAEEGRGDLADLRGTLRTLQAEVGRAVEVGALLERDGRTIDVGGLVDRVTAVEALRDRLTQPDGELLDAASLEIRLQELQGRFVSQDDLTQAIDDVRSGIGSGTDPQVVLDEARLAGRDAAVDAVGTLGTQLRTDIAARFDGVGVLVDERVATRTASLRDDVLGAARAELDAAVGTGDAAVRADLTALVDERFTAADALIAERFAGLPDLVGAQVARQVETELDAAFAAVEGRVARLESSASEVDRRLAANEASIAEAVVRLETTRRDDAALRARLRTELLDRVAGVEAEIEPRVSAAVDGARTVLRTDLQAGVAAARRDLETRLVQVAREAAATEVQVLATSVRTDVQSIVRQEIDANLDVVRREMATELEGLNQRVTGMVSNAVTRATADIPGLVSTELEAFRPELLRLIDTRVTRPPVPPNR